MEKKRVKKKDKSKKTISEIFGQCCFCTLENKDVDELDWDDFADVKANMFASHALHHGKSISFHQTTSSYYVMNTPSVLDNILPSALVSECSPRKSEQANEVKKGGFQNDIDPIDREQKDQLVKTILSKYLELKTSDMLNGASSNEHNLKPSQNEKPILVKPREDPKPDFIIECASSDSSQTIFLDNNGNNVNNFEVPRSSTSFPTKCKSAPTTNLTHDSLADICFKMTRFKEPDNKSDSFVTCTSEENTEPKKHLELVFNHSSEELSSHGENSTLSLQYKISCETTPSKRVSLPHDSQEKYNQRSKDKSATSQELHILSSSKSKIRGNKSSKSSLKWKLIISHHDHGDFN